MLVLRVGHAIICRGGDEALLQQLGVRSERVASGHDALEFLRQYEYDVVLMDFQLPDLQGHEVVRMMRGKLNRTPVVILSDTATVQAKVKALNQGADDFLTTPCDAEEILARIRAVVRRSQGHAASTLTLGPVELLLDRRDVRVHGKSLHLSRREYAVLELLFLRRGAVLNKEAFLTHLYCGTDEPTTKTIDVIICRLRKKLALAGVAPLIETVWGCGYILGDPAALAMKAAQNAWPAGATEAVAA
jgi:two-component system cell cycle response regulator CtrA